MDKEGPSVGLQGWTCVTEGFRFPLCGADGALGGSLKVSEKLLLFWAVGEENLDDYLESR